MSSIFILFLLIGILNAVPPFNSQSFSEGFVIEIPQDNILKTGENYTFSFHVYNISNGVPVMDGISCGFHLYGMNGEHVYEGTQSTPVEDSDYSFYLSGGNFSQKGSYYYFIQCNSSILGGNSKSILRVFDGGEEPTTAKSILYVILLLICFLFMGIALYGSIALDGKNEFQMGKLIKINYNKYIKQGLFFISYLFLIFTTFFASEISQNFIEVGFFSTVLNYVHLALWIALLPIFIISVTFSLIKWLADLELMDLAKRNLKPYGS